MLFNSYIFILAFLPVMLIGYFLIQSKGTQKVALGFLTLMSFVFVAWLNFWYLPVLIVSILFNYFLGEGILSGGRECPQGQQGRLQEQQSKSQEQANSSKILLIIGIVINILALFFFKYFDFFAGSLNDVFKTNIPLIKIILPLGISFYTFSQISYIVDCYKYIKNPQTQDPLTNRTTVSAIGDAAKENGMKYSLLEYAAYVSYFPKFIQGPIALHNDIVPQFRDEMKWKVNYDNLSSGLYIFGLGLGKKVLLADVLALIVNAGYNNAERIYGLGAVLAFIAYSLQIYFDFSGYCDMACGVSRMLNIDLPINFNSPYKAVSISDFWDRWHITLTKFFTKYLYIPMGGSRRGKGRTYLNVMIVFLVSGLWHGANWTFVLWGALHGLLMVIERALGINKRLRRKMAESAEKSDGENTAIAEKTGSDNTEVAEKPDSEKASDADKSESKKTAKIISCCRKCITFILVTVLWSLFRADSLEQFKLLWYRVFRGYFFYEGVNPDIVNAIGGVTEFQILTKIIPGFVLNKFPGIMVIGFIVLGLILCFGTANTNERLERFKANKRTAVTTVVIILWCILSLSNITQFIYSNF